MAAGDGAWGHAVVGVCVVLVSTVRASRDAKETRKSCGGNVWLVCFDGSTSGSNAAMMMANGDG